MERRTGYKKVEGTRGAGGIRVLSAKDMKDTKIRNVQGEDLGTIKDLMLDVDAGEVVYAVLAYGGVLGIGEKDFAIPWEALTPRPEERVLVGAISKERLDRAEGIDLDNPPMEGNWDLVETPRPTAARPVTTPPAMPSRPIERERVEARGETPATATSFEQLSAGMRGERREERVVTHEEMPSARTEIVQERAMPPAGAGLEHLSAADLQVYLKGMDYPSDKRGLIAHAEERKAPPSVHEALRRFEEREYRSAADVSKEFGHVKEPGRMQPSTTAERPGETGREVRPTAAEEVSLKHVSAADLQSYLKGMDYPAGKQELISHARERNAPAAVVESLRRFEERKYRSPAEVSQEFGRIK